MAHVMPGTYVDNGWITEYINKLIIKNTLYLTTYTYIYDPIFKNNIIKMNIIFK